MTRTISPAMEAQLALPNQTRARCLFLGLRNGQTIGITDHDRPILGDMPDISGEPVMFNCATGIMPSDVSLSTGLESDSFEVTGPLGDLITAEAVMGRRFYGALARLFDVDWTQDALDVLPILSGRVRESHVEGGRFVFEVRDSFDAYNQVIGELLSPYCGADFGDTRCGVVPEEAVGVISAVTSDYRFRVSLSGGYASGYFNLGTVTFTSGNLAGEVGDILSYSGAGDIETFVPMPGVPAGGDGVIVRVGCSKLHHSDDDAVRTCMFYDNARRFRGFKDVPGTDQYLKMPIPKI